MNPGRPKGCCGATRNFGELRKMDRWVSHCRRTSEARDGSLAQRSRVCRDQNFRTFFRSGRSNSPLPLCSTPPYLHPTWASSCHCRLPSIISHSTADLSHITLRILTLSSEAFPTPTPASSGTETHNPALSRSKDHGCCYDNPSKHSILADHTVKFPAF
jgi:hypothetical protein